MIVAKPNPQTLFSFAIFALASGVMIYFNASNYFLSQKPMWYNFAILLLLIPILGYVLYRLFFQLKKIEIGNNQITVNYLFFRTKQVYQLSEVETWKEHNVKVGKATNYKELEINFSNKKKITLGHKEYSSYDKITNYLTKKISKKKII